MIHCRIIYHSIDNLSRLLNIVVKLYDNCLINIYVKKIDIDF